EDRAVHLSSAGDHVLHVVGVAGGVDVRVVALVGLVLDVRDVDRDAALLLLGRVVDRVEVARLVEVRELVVQDLRDRGAQRGLAVVDVTDGADVDVRLGPLELGLGHCGVLLGLSRGTSGSGSDPLPERRESEGSGGTGEGAYLFPRPLTRPGSSRRSRQRCWTGPPRSCRTASCTSHDPGSWTAGRRRTRTSPTAGREHGRS